MNIDGDSRSLCMASLELVL